MNVWQDQGDEIIKTRIELYDSRNEGVYIYCVDQKLRNNIKREQKYKKQESRLIRFIIKERRNHLRSLNNNIRGIKQKKIISMVWHFLMTGCSGKKVQGSTTSMTRPLLLEILVKNMITKHQQMTIINWKRIFPMRSMEKIIII